MNSSLEGDAVGTLGLTRRDAVAERERLRRALEESAETAFASRGIITRHFTLLGRPFTFRFAGSFLERAMGRALAHLAADQSSTEPDLVVDCWDCAGDDHAFPRVHWPAKFFSARGEILGLDSARGRVAFFPWLNLLNAYFPDERKAYYCLAEGEPFPLQQAGSPALTIFNWWGETIGLQLVHGAVVGKKNGGVLIAGHGGAGKSTLAFSTLGSSLQFLSDDYFLLGGPPATAIALFASGKLTEQSLSLLGDLHPLAANAHDENREKALFYLEEQFPGQLLPQVSLRAIVLSHLCETETSLVPVESGEVHRIIAQSTLQQLAGTGPESFLRLRRMLQGIPVFRLNHGRDRSETHRLLAELCGS